MNDLERYLSSFDVVFWDFDGTIKKSESVKAEALKELFRDFDERKIHDIVSHHLKYGGVSRYEKIPLYLEWVGEIVCDESIEFYCDKFSSSVVNKIIDSSWVESSKSYIEREYEKQDFVLVTAAPHEEIIDILYALDFRLYFKKVYGYPDKKSNSVCAYLKEYNILGDNAVLVGDSMSDLEAANENGVRFILRESKYNCGIDHDGGRFR